MLGEQRPFTDDQQRQSMDAAQREWDEKWAPAVDNHVDELKAYFDSETDITSQNEDELLRKISSTTRLGGKAIFPESGEPNFDALSPSESEETLLRIEIAEFSAPFNKLSVEEYKELLARERAEDAQNSVGSTKKRGLYEDLTIRDRSRSKAQSRIIDGIASKGGW